MFYSIFPEKDATLYEVSSSQNTGLDEVLELQNTQAQAAGARAQDTCGGQEDNGREAHTGSCSAPQDRGKARGADRRASENLEGDLFAAV